MEKSFGLFFYLKKTKKYKEGGDATIYLRITVNCISTEVSARLKCNPVKWSQVAGRVEGKTDYAKAINTYLEVVQRKIYEYRKQLAENDQPVTASNIKLLLQNRELPVKKYMLMEILNVITTRWRH